MARALVASNDLALPAKRGGRAITHVSIPGSLTSIVYWAVPLTLEAVSTFGTCLPM
jgi:hypothetical protein